MSAVVRDKKGRFVPHLSREDFIVVEGGERRQIVGFNAEADGPVKVAVLFDISGSMRIGTKAVDAQQAARQLFSSMKSGDEAALFAFDTQLQKVSGFTTDFKGLESKVDKVSSSRSGKRRSTTRLPKRPRPSPNPLAATAGCRSDRPSSS